MEKSFSDDSARQAAWDCGSSLYDSVELKALQQQLDSAIATTSRTFSMPHFSSSEFRLSPSPNQKLVSKVSRTLQRLLKLRSAFRRRRYQRISRSADRTKEPGFYYVFYDKFGAHTSIPEGSESDGILSPET